MAVAVVAGTRAGAGDDSDFVAGATTSVAIWAACSRALVALVALGALGALAALVVGLVVATAAVGGVVAGNSVSRADDRAFVDSGADDMDFLREECFPTRATLEPCPAALPSVPIAVVDSLISACELVAASSAPAAASSIPSAPAAPSGLLCCSRRMASGSMLARRLLRRSGVLGSRLSRGRRLLVAGAGSGAAGATGGATWTSGEGAVGLGPAPL